MDKKPDDRKVPFHWYTSTITKEDGLHHINHVQDVEPIIERNKKLLDDHSDWRPYANAGDFKLVASVPAVEAMKLHAKYGFLGPKEERNDAGIKRALNDRDHKFFRTAPGKI
jgi:hypothetical protein